jgi:parallel beta-helix repeat protein
MKNTKMLLLASAIPSRIGGFQMKRMLFLLSTGLLLGTQCALATTLIVGTCRPGTHFTTISAAVAAAPSGATVEVCPGTYSEQVQISTPLNLTGLTSGNSGRVIVTPPSGGLTASFASPIDGVVVFPQVMVTTGPVNVTGITVDGTGNGVSADWLAGIAYVSGASGTVNGVTAREEIGGTHGVGIWAENANSTSESVTIENSQIHDTDNTGILARSSTTSAQLTVKLVGNQMINTPFGIRNNSAGTVMGNVITDHSSVGIWTVSLSTASVVGNTISALRGGGGDVTGIRVAGAGESVKSNVILDENGTIASYGIDIRNATGATVEANKITNANIGIEFVCKTGNTVSGNTINDASLGLDLVPTGLSVPGTYQNVDNLRTGGC